MAYSGIRFARRGNRDDGWINDLCRLPESTMSLPTIKLRKDQERRLRAGHLWIYSNEVDTAATPLRDFWPGDPVAILSQRGKWLQPLYCFCPMS